MFFWAASYLFLKRIFLTTDKQDLKSLEGEELETSSSANRPPQKSLELFSSRASSSVSTRVGSRFLAFLHVFYDLGVHKNRKFHQQ